MTLLTICQDVFNEIGTFTVPDSIIGNLAEDAQQILAIANKSGKLLAEKRQEGWQVQQIGYLFNTVADKEDYDFPGAYNWSIQATMWDRLNQWYMFGPTSPQKWQQLKAYVSSASIRRHWRIQGDKILLYPIPSTTGDPIVMEYVTEHWCKSADGMTLRSRWAADDDTALIDESLIQMDVKWRFLKEKGLPYGEDFNDFERALDRAIARDGGVAKLHMTGAGYAKKYPIAHTPEGTFPGQS